MPEDFDPSPRASKRRKVTTYTSSRSIRTETENQVPSIWDNVSSSVTGLSRRLFLGSRSSAQPDDCAAESQDDIGAGGGSQTSADEVQEIAESENESLEIPRSRRANRQTRQTSTQTPASNSRKKLVNPNATKAQGSWDALPGGKKQKSGPTSRSALGGLPETSNDASVKSVGVITSDAVMDNAEEDSITVQPRSSGRDRKKTRKYDIEPAEIQESPKSTTNPAAKLAAAQQKSVAAKKTQQPALVGILTPSKKNEKKSKKSVVFGDGEKQIETDFGFKDISSPTRKADSLAPGLPQDKSTPSLTPKKSKQKPQEVSLVRRPEFDADILPDEDLMSEDLTPTEPNVELPAIQPDDTDLSEDSPELLRIKATILARLTSRAAYTERPALPSHLQPAYEILHTLLRTTVVSGESNSLLLLGSRGAGKSLLVNTALASLHHSLATEFHTVRLNGFIQTDDRLALREIWRQLGREMDVDESETNQVSGSYADTMTSLLGLLSQPEEVPDIGAVEYAAEKVVTKSVVFILDEFDRFTSHPRQTLLYNLFDIAQSRKAPIAVIGCSARTDCVECLEKRVKSRFSHRWVHVAPPKNLAAFEEVARENLLMDGKKLSSSVMERESLVEWNEYIQNKFLPSLSIQSLISSTFHTTKSLPSLFAALYNPIATASLPNAPPACSPDYPSLLSLLPSLPHVHLALLVCATRLEAIHSLSTCNFNIVYAHYTDLITKSRIAASAGGVNASGMRMWGRDVCLRAWEELIGWEFVVRVGREDGEGLDAGMCRVDVAIEEVRWAEEMGGKGEGLGRWCREV